MKMLLTGKPISAQYAKEIGLINDYFNKSQLEKEVLNGKIFFITTKINSNWSNTDFKSVLSDILDRILFQKMISNAF